uniref:Secreted protein n=2 Tax=Terrapene triunguis TaxID=2587831 RepID=A0A674J1K4_9SAUR
MQSPTLRAVMFWMLPLKLLIIWSTLWATSWVRRSSSVSTAGSMGGMSAALLRPSPGKGWPGGSGSSRLPRELSLIFSCRLLATKWVRSPSWLTVPSSSRALEMVARRPSCARLAPYAWLIPSKLRLSSSRPPASLSPATEPSRHGSSGLAAAPGAWTRTWAMMCCGRPAPLSMLRPGAPQRALAGRGTATPEEEPRERQIGRDAGRKPAIQFAPFRGGGSLIGLSQRQRANHKQQHQDRGRRRDRRGCECD